MLNQFVVVGIVMKRIDYNEENPVVTLIVPRAYKNNDGVYDNDFIDIKLYKSTTNLNEYVKIGDIVGVRGKIESSTANKLELIAEKVTYLSTKKESDDNE